MIEIVGPDKLRMKPTPPADLLDLVKEHKTELLVALAQAAARTTTFPELPSIVFWLTKTGAIYKGDRFLRMGAAKEVRDGERFSGIVLSTMPAREERFWVPCGAIAWQAGDDIRTDTWRPLKELPKAWRE